MTYTASNPFGTRQTTVHPSQMPVQTAVRPSPATSAPTLPATSPTSAQPVVAPPATVQIATLRRELRRLRRMTRNGKSGRIAHRAADDANTLIGWRFADLSVSRRAALGYGMGRRRWAWAVAMLRLAGCVDVDASRAWLDDAFYTAPPNEHAKAIAGCVARLDQANNLAELRRHLPGV